MPQFRYSLRVWVTSSFVVLELFLLALPCVSPKHIHEEIVLTGAKVVWASCVIGGEGFRGRSQRVGGLNLISGDLDISYQIESDVSKIRGEHHGPKSAPAGLSLGQ
jgi:hypothetical protein